METEPTPVEHANASKWRIVFRVVAMLVAVIALYGVLPEPVGRVLRGAPAHRGQPALADRHPGVPARRLRLRVVADSHRHPAGHLVHRGDVAIGRQCREPCGARRSGRGDRGGLADACGVRHRPSRAGTAIAATSLLSNGVLFAIPLVAVVGSILGAPIPRELTALAWGGAVVFVLLFAFAFVIVRFNRPLHAFGRAVQRVRSADLRPVAQGQSADGRGCRPTAQSDRRRVGRTLATGAARGRGELVGGLPGARMPRSTPSSRPKLSLVLLAFGVGAVAGMIPITPGGLGFVEAGLVGTLALAGISGDQALLATLAYRIVSYWLPMVAGLGTRGSRSAAATAIRRPTPANPHLRTSRTPPSGDACHSRYGMTAGPPRVQQQ